MRIHTGWPLAAVLLAIGCVGVTGCSRSTSESKTAAVETQVLVSAIDVVRVESRRLEGGISFSGELTPSEFVTVIARFAGDLEAVRVREGEPVRQGQSLAVYRPRDIQDQLAAAEAGLLSAQAALLAAQNGERRAQRLLEAGGAAPSDLELAKAQRAAAEAQARAAEAYRNTAKEDAEKLDVPSPITGWVNKTFQRAGDRTAIGDAIAEVVDTRVLELSATVPADALARIQPGTPIRIRIDAFPGEVFSGSVDRVSPMTEPGTRQVRLFARIPNPDGRLVGGLFVSGRVIDAAKDDAIVAPVAALRTEGSEQVVYRLQQAHAKRVPITTGILDEEAGIVELLGEVSPGDSLLTGVLPGLRDGAPVRVLTAANGTTAAAAPAAGR
jgi:membrane fusion protein, multidrug efflux system